MDAVVLVKDCLLGATFAPLAAVGQP